MTRLASGAAEAAAFLLLFPSAPSAQLPEPPITEFEFITIECSDGLDNDGDGRVDFPEDPGCVDADDEAERTPTRGARARFAPLRLPRDTEGVVVRDVSNHGRVIVGEIQGEIPGDPYLRPVGSLIWKRGRPRLIEDLRPFIAEGLVGSSSAWGVSDHGRFIVGSRTPVDEPFALRAYLWKRRVLVDLDSEPGDGGGAGGVSDTGVAVGQARLKPARWANGMLTILEGPLYGDNQTAAFAITPDASFSVGSSRVEVPPSPQVPDATVHSVATVWQDDDPQGTAIAPLDELRFLPGFSAARDVSDDGETIIGTVNLFFVQGPIRTTFAFRARGGAIQFFGRNVGDESAVPSIDLSSITADGSLAAGSAVGVGPIVLDGSRLRSLVDLLENEYGVDLRGWDLSQGHFAGFTTISPDGRVLVGNGTDPEGNRAPWWVRLPPVCADGLDNDGDGRIDHPEDAGCRFRSSRSEHD